MSSLVRKSVERLRAYVPGEQPDGPDVVKLNTNENPYPPSPAVAAALACFDVNRLRLYPNSVGLRLRQALASYHGCDVSRVFVGNGSDEVLALCTRAFVADGGSIGFFDPSYSLYPVLAAVRDVPTAPVALGRGFEWCMPWDYRASLFFLTNPNAPTGLQYETATVADFCDGFEGVVVVDEAYVDFAEKDCVHLALSRPNVLVARTFSKAYSLAGLRVGYAVGPPELIGALMKIKDSYNLDALSQELATAAVGDAEHMRANAGRIKATRRRLSDALLSRGFCVWPSAANFVWTRPPGGSDASALFGALKERRVYVRHFPGERTGDCLRITIGLDKEVDALLGALDEMM